MSRIGIDTNVLVRFIVKDDEAQATLAKKALTETCTQSNPGFVNSIVLVELYWVLSSAYGYSRKEIAKVIEFLLSVRELTIEHAAEAWAALQESKQQNTDFPDAYLCQINESNDCKKTITLDKKAARLDGFDLITKPRPNSNNKYP